MTLPLAETEQQRVADLFRESLVRQQGCGASLDAQVQLSIKSLWQNWGITGYVQAQRPALLKFVGINPLGQPLVFLTSDGEVFRWINVPEGKSYEGPVSAAALRKYLPADSVVAGSFFWLTGALATDRPVVRSVAKAAGEEGYWLELTVRGQPGISRLLFDPVAGVIRRHLLLNDQRHLLAEVGYGGHSLESATSNCLLPGTISIRSAEHDGASIEIALSARLPNPNLSRADFEVVLPAGFERIVVR